MSEVRNGQFTRTQSFMPQSRDPVQPRFHIEPVQDEAATAAQGRPIFRNEERVQFIMPGSPNQPVFRVSDEHRERWPDQYAAFRRGEDHSVEGTPLEQWPIMTRAMVLELKAMNVFTVEQCAGLSDMALQKIGRGGYALRERAKAYLDEAEALAFSERLNRENELLNSRIVAQDRQLAEQRELLDRLHGQVQAMANTPNAVAAYRPSENDPIAIAQQAVVMPAPEPSSLDGLGPVKRRPGRPTNAELEAKRRAQEAA